MDIIDQTLHLSIPQRIGILIGATLLVLSLIFLLITRIKKSRVRRRIRKIRKRKSPETMKKSRRSHD